MSSDVEITYVNNSMNPATPTVFIFTKNRVPTFDVLKDGVAWKTMAKIGKGSSCKFTYPIRTTVQAMWGTCYKTHSLDARIGKRYKVEEDETGIVLTPDGNASQTTAIEVTNTVQVNGGIKAQLCKEGKVLVTKNVVAYNQKATFILHPKIYWGVASEIQEGQFISSAVLDTDNFFKQELEGVTHARVTLNGNPHDGYHFVVDNNPT